MNRMQKWIQTVLWSLIFVLGLYILYRGFAIAGESGILQKIPLVSGIRQKLETVVVDAYIPGINYKESETSTEKSWLDHIIGGVSPLLEFVNNEKSSQPDIESQMEYELLVAAEQEKETEAQVETESQTETETGSEEETETEKESETQKLEVTARAPIQEIPMDKLQDFNYLLNTYFAVDPSTTADSSQINIDALMGKDLKMSSDNSAPQILIYHTHSQEAFADSVEGDVSTTIVGVGERLTEILRDTYGYNVIHHTKVYDMIDGKLDRNMAYTLAAPDVQQILDENPSIEVVIDLHRDGVDGHKFVTDIDGKPTAQIMFFNGLSRTARNGDIDYLYNPYIADNLAFSFQLQLKAAQYYPDFTRNIYLQSLRYNLHMKPKALLIESGTQLNTVQEELNAMEPLADIMNQVLRGE